MPLCGTCAAFVPTPPLVHGHLLGKIASGKSGSERNAAPSRAVAQGCVVPFREVPKVQENVCMFRTSGRHLVGTAHRTNWFSWLCDPGKSEGWRRLVVPRSEALPDCGSTSFATRSPHKAHFSTLYGSRELHEVPLSSLWM